MITALSVIYPDKGKNLKKLISFLKKDRVDVQIKDARGVHLKHITYISHSGKIKVDKIDKLIGAQRNHLLCAESLDLPSEKGYRRFSSPVFTARLCTNMALYALKNCACPEKLRIGIYDPKAVACDFLSCVLSYCSDVIVVTETERTYYAEMNRITEETGAVAVITNREGELADRDFIIAPSNIDKKIPVKSDALILTNGCPKVITNGLVYYKYYLRMPNGFDRIKPGELDEEYFCSALYSLGSQYELGSIVPTLCRNYSTAQTAKSLTVLLDNYL
ncbi:MAG: hypothetical protein LUF33_07720 [Clostridiales bacterium]|nr:hypothetical protein [Clostridiales bacterium]